MVENRDDLCDIDAFPQRDRNGARLILTEECNSLYKVPSHFTEDQFGVPISVEPL